MPVSIELMEAMNYAEGGQFGHRIQLQVSVPNRGDARLNWLERTNKPYVEGMPVDAWVDMYRLQPTSAVFAPWVESEGEEGQVTLMFTDPPSIRQVANAQRTLDFWIVVLDGIDGEGGGGDAWGLFQARQTLRCDAHGAIVEQVFVITGDQAGSDSDPPYPPGWRPY